jgi:hypothetical protein
MATALLEVVQSRIEQADRRHAFAEFYRVCLAGVEAFCIQAERMQQRMKPSRN